MGKGKHYPPGNQVLVLWRDAECGPTKENNSPLKVLAGPGPRITRLVQGGDARCQRRQKVLTLTVRSILSSRPNCQHKNKVATAW